MPDFQREPRAFALDLVDRGVISAENLLTACLSYMSHDDVRGMLDANELSPRFDEDDDEDDQDEPFDHVEFIMAFEAGELTGDEQVAGFQQLIDSGIVWKLQGFYGRTAQSLIDAGLCRS